jgi:hypothetical protein
VPWSVPEPSKLHRRWFSDGKNTTCVFFFGGTVVAEGVWTHQGSAAVNLTDKQIRERLKAAGGNFKWQMTEKTPMSQKWVRSDGYLFAVKYEAPPSFRIYNQAFIDAAQAEAKAQKP